MIKTYDPNVFEGIHTIRVTFMKWDFVGHVAFAMGGNCRGADILNCDFLEFDDLDDIARYTENDCQFAFDDEYEEYTASFKNSKGEELIVVGNEREFKDMVISIEIIDFQPEKEEEELQS